MDTQKNKETGFSLVEVVISIALLGVLSTSLLLALQELSIQTINLQKRTQALMVMQSGLERVLFENNQRGFGWLKPKNFPDEENADGFEDFRRHYGFKKLSPRLMEVVVQVSWKEGQEYTTLWVRKTK